MRSQHQPTEDLRHFIGIDGGGSGTRARIVAPDGSVLGSGDAGPSALGQGVEQAWDHVRLAIARCFAQAGLALPEPASCAVGLGLAGAHSPVRCDAFMALAPAYGLLALDTDAGTALRGAHGGVPGAIVAAGTGSVGEALRRNGQRITVGGWGFGIGDEGSGAWLGLAAMRQAHRALDGRAAPGALARAVWRTAGGQRDALLDWCARAGQHGFARLAPLVFDTADADITARHLLDEAAAALVEMATALDPEAELPLVLTGSVALRLKPWLPASLLARCVTPQGDAIDGALLLVRQPTVCR
ncbi:BadF/BadG/BcrA/BcrD ATPase family protein [Aquabacterium sp.]|uniref:BadF/BadG/BcrA/BcrD ATPase family protein n=1 Tax=Aquabacterium sp. TaxID=1872578 RepID=UPI002C3E5F1B|nr:BadF/BadG/BcrA/BcrD ATPase family protein [Aquabacterium sp.]HSW04502.1 BadF/BadG/BcrA/BcrD ATPase family protein [Aquabacterium sp.]